MINDIAVCYNLPTTDHIPVIIDMHVDGVPDVAPGTNNNNQRRVDWSRLDKGSVNNCCRQTDTELKNFVLPIDAIICTDVNYCRQTDTELINFVLPKVFNSCQ